MRKIAEPDMYTIGSNIRAARKRADLTQEELSESIGVSPHYISDLERGLVGVSTDTLIKICNTLNVSADFILFGNGSGANSINSTLIERIQRLPKHKADMVSLFLEAMEMDPEQKTYK